MSEAQPTQVHLDPTLTEACVTGSLAAYSDFAKQPFKSPKGFKCVHRFTGWDDLIDHSGEAERFGLIFQSSADPSTYMVAFRGTDSLMDAYEDAWFDTVDFQPFDAQGFPSGVEVSSGFYSVYTGTGAGVATPMRTQVFDFLDNARPAPTKVIVTGHSLGAAIANLFMLDYSVSRPNVHTVSVTLASPRTGKTAFHKAYEQTYGLTPRTYRIANFFDWVPTLPPKTILDYRHVGQRFLVAFYLEHGLDTDILSRHSLLNYQTVLTNALAQPNQIWAPHTFRDAVSHWWYPFHTMKSIYPDLASDMPEWASLWRELHGAHKPKDC